MISSWCHHESATCIHVSPPSWASSPPPNSHFSPLGHHRAPSWVPQAIQQVPTGHFTHGSVCMSLLLAPFIPTSPSLSVPTSPFSTSGSLFLPWRQVHYYQFSRFHIHVHLYTIFLASCWVPQSCPTLCEPMDCSLLGSSVRGISQARISKWVAIPFSWGSFWPKDWTCISCTGRWILNPWATGIPSFWLTSLYMADSRLIQ